MPQSQKNGTYYLFAGLLIWGIINFFQAYFTELDPDEAYYWMYSRQLDWGYFDHPPALAVIISAGYSLIANSLGVRLGFILLQLLSFYLLYDLAGRPQEKRDIRLFLLLLAAMPLMQIYGFVATPDGPLLFFAVLFFWLYDRFVKTNSWLIATFLGLCMAALLYSKYHGVVLIFLVLLSNLSLLRNPRFYYAAFLGALVFTPHLWWQIQHDFPSFRYHLKGRNDTYELKYTITYVLNQLVIFSPLLFPLIVIALRRTRVDTKLKRAFYFVIAGFWGFFFYSSFKGHVEPQWTILLSIPFVLLIFWEAQKSDTFRKWANALALLTVILLLIARVFMVINPLNLKSNFHNSSWIGPLQEMAEGHPVVFQNSYRNASKYSFYTGEQAYTITDHKYRQNQFDIWDWDKRLQNDTIYLARVRDSVCTFCPKLSFNRQVFRPQIIEDFQTYSNIEIDFSWSAQHFKAGDSLSMELRLYNPYEYPISFFTGNAPIDLSYIIYQDADPKGEAILPLSNPALVLDSKSWHTEKLRFSLPKDLEPGAYQMAFGLGLRQMPPVFNSKLVELIID